MTAGRRQIEQTAGLAAHSRAKAISFLLALVPFAAILAGCTQQFTLQGPGENLAARSTTEPRLEVYYPDDNPSVADGKDIWNNMTCAECHGDSGAPVAGKSTVDLSNSAYMGKQKPVDQYQFLAYGRQGGRHPLLKDQLSTRELWDLVFYVRSLAITPLTQATWDKMDPVFGSNCAVCHGKKGFGDGPLAHNMEPVPANFHQFNRFFNREDDMLVDHIANGIRDPEGTPTFAGMPEFLNKTDKAKNVKFDEPFIRQMVGYVRLFHSSTSPTIEQPARSQGEQKEKRVKILSPGK